MLLYIRRSSRDGDASNASTSAHLAGPMLAVWIPSQGGMVSCACTQARHRAMFACNRHIAPLHACRLLHAGPILSRFSRDTEIMDLQLPMSLINLCFCVSTYVAVAVVLTVATRWFGLALLPLTLLYALIQRCACACTKAPAAHCAGTLLARADRCYVFDRAVTPPMHAAGTTYQQHVSCSASRPSPARPSMPGRLGAPSLQRVSGAGCIPC